MPRINFDRIADIEDYSPIEPGTYPCRLDEVEEATTQFGDDLWKLRWVITEGPNQGRILFDNMVFSEAALKRVKHICAGLGLDPAGEIDLTPDRLRGRSCLVTVDIEEYEDNEGRMKTHNVVPFAGYKPMDIAVDSYIDTDETPF